MKIKVTEQTLSDIMDASQGICIMCGAVRDCCEPDAVGYDCSDCGRDESVHGTEGLLLSGLLDIVDTEAQENVRF